MLRSLRLPRHLFLQLVEVADDRVQLLSRFYDVEDAVSISCLSFYLDVYSTMSEIWRRTEAGGRPTREDVMGLSMMHGKGEDGRSCKAGDGTALNGGRRSSA